MPIKNRKAEDIEEYAVAEVIGEKPRHRQRTIEIPIYYLPDELQTLHARLLDAREELKASERNFREKLAEFFESLQAKH